MPLIFGAIAPHGSIVPGQPEATASLRTTAAMQAIGNQLEALRPETIVIVTPHGMRVDGAVAISASEMAKGSLEELPAIRVEVAIDRAFARQIATQAGEAGVPIATLHYGATSGPHDCYPLDWGAIVPLWFLGARFAVPPRVVLAVPSRAVSLETLFRFGQSVAEVAKLSPKHIALIASSDLAHAHQADGPYGYDPAAAAFDDGVQQAVRENDLPRLLHVDQALVEHAKPDGLWQIAVLAGALERQPLSGVLLSYERPSYYGMLCAAYADPASTSPDSAAPAELKE